MVTSPDTFSKIPLYKVVSDNQRLEELEAENEALRELVKGYLHCSWHPYCVMCEHHAPNHRRPCTLDKRAAELGFEVT